MDPIDRKILNTLQLDGRITNLALAQTCGLSTAACYERVRRLRDSGYIQRYVALLDPARLDRALLVFVEVLLDRTTDDAFNTFAAHVQTLPDVMECYMVAGGFDYLLKVRVSDMAAYRTFLGATLAMMPGVRETRTYPVIEDVKSTTALPL